MRKLAGELLKFIVVAAVTLIVTLLSLFLTNEVSGAPICPVHGQESEHKEIFVPTVFTPNGDELKVVSSKDLVKFRLRIFDKRGNLLFNTDDI